MFKSICLMVLVCVIGFGQEVSKDEVIKVKTLEASYWQTVSKINELKVESMNLARQIEQSIAGMEKTCVVANGKFEIEAGIPKCSLENKVGEDTTNDNDK